MQTVKVVCFLLLYWSVPNFYHSVCKKAQNTQQISIIFIVWPFHNFYFNVGEIDDMENEDGSDVDDDGSDDDDDEDVNDVHGQVNTEQAKANVKNKLLSLMQVC